MDSRTTVRTAVFVMAVLIITTMLTGQVLAQEELYSTWSGNRIRESSMNWADFVNETAATVGPLQAWAGPKIDEASTNWADYAGGSVAVSVKQTWSGQQVQNASQNWADYVSEPVVASQQK